MSFLEYLKIKIKSSKILPKYYREYFKKIRLSSFPYVSGDTFLALADCAVIGDLSKPIYFSSIEKKEIIFIEVDYFDNKEIFNLACNFKKVIIHNGDTSPNMNLINQLAKKKIFVYGTNINFTDDYIKPIPIGLENAHFRRNGNLNYFNPLQLSRIDKHKENILLTSFSLTSKVRVEYEKILTNRNIINNKGLDLNTYRKLLAKSYFVLSPPGNGIDCHRTWEAFYNNTIPVIEKKYYLFNHLNLPVLIVDKLNDFLDLSIDDKINKYNEINSQSKDQIYMKWWINHIEKD